SLDQGDHFAEVGPKITANSGAQIGYGATDNPDVLYVGAGNKVHVRVARYPGRLVEAATFEQNIDGIVVDPANSRTAFAVAGFNVFRTTDAGKSWTKVTGNLAPADPLVRTLAYAPDVDGGTLIVGTNTGVFAASGPSFSNWSRLGSGFPTVPV